MAQNNFIESKRRGRFFRYAPLILWIGVVFFLSSSQGSTTRTSPIIRPLLEFIFPGATEGTLIIYQNYIRKLAHFAEYAILAFFASRAFWNSTVRFLRKFWQFSAFILVFSVAATDEYNQSFNILRTSSVYDVLLDMSGGLVMIFILTLFQKNR